MRYFTPEWHQDTVVCEMYMQLRKTQKAAEFSEKFYQNLYKIEKKAFLRYSKRIARFSREKFDAAAAQNQFDANYQENLAFVKANLPSEILEKVKDIRVLALGSAEYDVAAEIERFCGRVDRKCRAVAAEYEDQLQAVAQITGWETVNSLDLLVGSPIESISQDGNTTVLTTSSELVGVSYSVELDDAAVALQDQSYVGSIIVQHELCAEDDSLCFGLLCLDGNSDPITVEIKAKQISIKKN
ncbi:MAG: DUF4085 family protein [Ruminococcaceae bacterium]|nr:DUF4085 family protein [Oscillospiraceae bacterium]